MPARRTSALARAVRLVPLALVAAAAVLAGGCSLGNDVMSGVTAPIGALPASDVAVETNLKTDLTLVNTALDAGSDVSSASGFGFVNGPSTGASETSYASLGSNDSLFVAYNSASRDCLGIVNIVLALSAPVLGATGPGTFYFVARATPPGGCDAAVFARTPARPANWPAGDPSSSGFPS